MSVTSVVVLFATRAPLVQVLGVTTSRQERTLTLRLRLMASYKSVRPPSVKRSLSDTGGRPESGLFCFVSSH